MPKRALALLLATASALQSACSGLAPAARDARHDAPLGKVAVVAALQDPEIRFEGFARDKAEGAFRGGTATFAACLSPLGQGCTGGPMCGVAILVFVGICGAASAVGGVVGAVRAPSGDSVATSESTLFSALERADVQEALRGQVNARFLAAGSASESIAPAAADTVIETKLTKVGTRRPSTLAFEPGAGGLGIDQPLQLYMHARVRLVRVSDDTTLSSIEHVYLGPRLKLADWSANGGAPLLQGMVAGYESLASHIYDRLFRLYRFPEQERQWSAYGLPVYGLAAVSPATRGNLGHDSLVAPILSWTAVPSLQPTLEWEAFPRKVDVDAAPGDMARVKDVRYELVLAREQNLAPAEIVYQRSNLSSPMHRLESALQPDTRYFWTVRASFQLDGRSRVTPWGATGFNAREEHTAPSHFSYRFRTPRAAR